ncbi:MAG TPA: hypothetical protein PKA31_01415 [Candidatus Moranbacteria bacterium]|nr:hypothetical protein [Candidatus Moranbacteria bacterium]
MNSSEVVGLESIGEMLKGLSAEREKLIAEVARRKSCGKDTSLVEEKEKEIFLRDGLKILGY